jgi:phosphate transport system protein
LRNIPAIDANGAAVRRIELQKKIRDGHRALFTALLDKDSPYGVEHAVDVTSIGRYYERFADHAVSVARRVVYLVTGQMPQELTEGV